MRQAAPDSTLVAYRQMCDVPHRGSHDRKLTRDEIRKFKICMPGHGADRDRIAPQLDEGHAGNMHEIDNDGRTRHPEI